MRRTVGWSADALNDLGDTLEHFAAFELERTLSLVDQIELAANRLGDYPTGRPGRVHGAYEKSLPKLKYIVAYSLDDPVGVLNILRVIHTSREWLPGSWPE